LQEKKYGVLLTEDIYHQLFYELSLLKVENIPILLKKIVFKRLNTGVVNITPQETRNALYDAVKKRSCLNFHLRQSLFMIMICDFAFTAGITKDLCLIL
jgi:hypothetical protein